MTNIVRGKIYALVECAQVQQGDRQAGRQAARQAHPVLVGRTRTRHPMSTNWYLLLLKCPELVATFHLVFHRDSATPTKMSDPGARDLRSAVQ